MIKASEFLNFYRNATEREKYLLVKELVCDDDAYSTIKTYCKRQFASEFDNDLLKEIDELSEKISNGMEAPERKVLPVDKTLNLKQIDILKKQIEFLSKDTFEAKFLFYNLNEEQMKILDDYFESTYLEVIINSLSNIRRMLDVRPLSKSFTSRTPVVEFPTYYYSDGALTYLEDKYRDKFNELNLDEIGIRCVSIVHSSKNKTNNSNLMIDYVDISNRKVYKYDNSIFDLVVDFDRYKKLQKQKI